MEKDFWRRITRDEIITDYNTKAVNFDAYQRRDSNSDTAGSLRASSPIWASEASLARLTSLTQIGELARRLHSRKS